MADKKDNTGTDNSGFCNSGSCNSGYYNSGNCNSGDCNSGDCNSGDCNSGDCNSGYRNSGFFNTDEPTVRMFNRETNLKRDDIDLPDFLYNLVLTEWIPESKMTDQEKIDNAHFRTEGGYLKTYEYKEAWANLWKDVTEDDIEELKALPNFDAKIFEEITGINIEKNTDVEKKKEELLKKADELIKQAEELKNQAKKF